MSGTISGPVVSPKTRAQRCSSPCSAEIVCLESVKRPCFASSRRFAKASASFCFAQKASIAGHDFYYYTFIFSGRTVLEIETCLRTCPRRRARWGSSDPYAS